MELFSFQLDEKVSLVVPVEGSTNEFIIAMNRTLCKLTWNKNGDDEGHKVEVTKRLFTTDILFLVA